MRTPVLAVAAATAVVTLALPSLAEETTEPVPTPACEPVEGAALIGPTKLEPFTVSAPLVPNAPIHDAADTGGAPVTVPEESLLDVPVLVDASGGTPATATRATATLGVAWEEPNGDFDVYVLDADGNVLGEGTSFNPTDGPGETVAGITVPHCTLLTLRISNYAGVPGSDLTISGTRTKLR